MRPLFSKISILLLTLIVGLVASSTAFGTATIVIQNNDAPNVGFNDPTPAAPVGGNNGTTVGQQRLNVFQFAADVWGATLVSGPAITIQAGWAAQTCTANSGTLGSAGAIGIFRDFPNAPFAGTWYAAALANALAGSDLNPSTPEINATFNVNVGNTGCLETRHWYYGLDNAHGINGIDLVEVLLHEFGHGLGFQTFTNTSTGKQAGDITNGFFSSIYDKFLFDNTTGKTWDQMTDAERVASAINFRKLGWSGPQVNSDAATVLSLGKDPSGRPLLYTPNPRQAGSSVSHWDTTATPDQLMEPNINDRPSHSVTTPQDLTFSLLRDIGWCSGCPQPPPPPPPTPTPPAAANDNFVNAQTIIGCAGSVAGHNFAATKEAGEPSHSPDTDPGGGSVWYQWQAPSSGSVTMTTEGSDYDTLLAVYTGNAVNALSVVLLPDGTPAKNDDVDLGVITTSTLTFNVTAGTLYKIAVDGWGNARGNIVLNWSESGCVSPNMVRLSATNYPIGEGQGSVVISVVRFDSTGTTTVDLRTADTDTFTYGCKEIVNNNHSAYGRCDFATTVTTVTIPPGQLSTNVLVPIIDDSWAEGTETFIVQLSNPTGASLGMPSTSTVTINDNETTDGSNPILRSDDAGISFLVRQHYLDFLAREPEVGEPWSAILRGCPDQFNVDPASPSAGCDRLFVSGNFFGSPEFKFKGVYVIDFYRVAFNWLPLYSEFSVDLASITGATAPETFAKRAAFADAFVLRPEFAPYGLKSNDDYVTALMDGSLGQGYNLTSITTPDPENPDGTTKKTLTTPDLKARLNGNVTVTGGPLTRAQVLRAIVQSDEVSQREAVNAFVASQYYGYLRRTPDTGGFNGWVSYLSLHPGDFRTMVNGFMNSTEYRLRFGPTP